MNKKSIKNLLFFTIVASIPACSTIPKGVHAITTFEKEKFLGKWYEIARFDYRFEREINNNTAVYSLREDGKIKVENRAYKYKKKEWKEVVGKAKIAGKENVGMLKVSFFGPFYSGYNVIAIDKDYKYALMAGKNLNYLWILSRNKTIPENIKSNYLKIAKDAGFEISKLNWIKHN